MPYLNTMATEYETTKRWEIQLYDGDTLESLMEMLQELSTRGIVIFEGGSISEDTTNLTFAHKTQNSHECNVEDIDIKAEIEKRGRKRR